MNAWLPQASYPCGTVLEVVTTPPGYILSVLNGERNTHYHLVCEHNRTDNVRLAARLSIVISSEHTAQLAVKTSPQFDSVAWHDRAYQPD